MKILFINNVGTKHAGAEIIISNLRSELKKQGHTVKILTGDETSNGELIADWHFKTFADNSNFLFKLLYVFNPFALWKLWGVLQLFKPDIVHMHNVSKASPFILLLTRQYPSILTIHDHLVFDPTRFTDIPKLLPYKKELSNYFIDTPSLRYYLEKIRFLFLRKFYKSVDLVLACSDFYCICAKQSKLFNRVITLHNGITLPKEKLVYNWNNLLFVGRIEEAKGVHILLKALPKILKENKKLHLKIVGSGSQINYIKNLAKELGVANFVKFSGHLSSKQIMNLNSRATIIIVPSLWPEPFGIVGLEAMGFGKPVIGTRVGGIPEWLENGKAGYLVDPGNSNQISDKVIQLISDRKKYLRMSKNARIKAEQFSIQKSAKMTEKIYFQVIKRR
jgi:glycosyltransferase involved in cell wall biosynthesis